MAKRAGGRSKGAARRRGSRARALAAVAVAAVAAGAALWLLARGEHEHATDAHAIDEASREKLLEVLREEDP